MSEVLTHRRFAILAGRISSRAASWAADSLDYPEDCDEPMAAEAVDRFVAAIAELTSYMVADSRDPPTKTTITAEALGPGDDPPGYVIPIPEEIPFTD